MAENCPGQILNARPLHVYPTHHRVRQLGVDTIKEYDNILDNLFSNNNPIMAVTPDDIAKLSKRLGAMWVRLEPFDGSQNVSDFFKDLQRHLSQTGNTTDQEKIRLSYIPYYRRGQSSLPYFGDANIWFSQISPRRALWSDGPRKTSTEVYILLIETNSGRDF